MILRDKYFITSHFTARIVNRLLHFFCTVTKVYQQGINQSGAN